MNEQAFVTKHGAVIRAIKRPGGYKYQVFDPQRGLFPPQGKLRTFVEVRDEIALVGAGFGGGGWA